MKCLEKFYKAWVRLAAVLILSSLLFFPTPAQANGSVHAPAQDWKELRTLYFAVIYPADYEILAQMMIANYGPTLDSEYERFAAVFEFQLNLPVSLRVYSTITEFQELNPLTPVVAYDSTHSHIGSGEISLIGANIINDPGWAGVAINQIRYELGVLFVEQISDLNSPPGLLAGVGRYVQDPELGEEIRSGVEKMAGFTPGKGWQAVLDDEDSFVDPGLQVKNASFVSFLVDTYSWSEFLGMLKAISTSDGYVQALTGTLAVTPEDLQKGWANYYDDYLQTRWKLSIFYAYDLSQLEQMVTAGAYSEAAQELKGMVDLLEKTRQVDGAEQAKALLAKAQEGQYAGEKAYQARQAITSGDYARAITLSGEALAQYALLGDQRRVDELEAYQERATEALGLHGEIEEIGSRILLQSDLGLSVPRLEQIGKRLAELGDEQGVVQVNQILSKISSVQQQRQLFVNAILVAGVMLLVGLRIWLGFRKPPLEATLG